MSSSAFGPRSAASSFNSGVSSGNQHTSWNTLLAAAIDVASKDSSEELQFAWETGFFRDIFQDESDPQVAWKHWLDINADTAQDSKEDNVANRVARKRKAEHVDAAAPVCFSVLSTADETTWEERREASMDKALTRWIYVISQWNMVEPELDVCAALEACSSVDKQKEILKDWLHSKAPGALLKRVNSLLRFHRAVGWGNILEGLPYGESRLYNYLSDSRAGGAKASQLKALREALVFVRYIFGIGQLQAFAGSRRCAGASKPSPKARKRAPPLKVSEIRFLHLLLEDISAPLWGRMFAGAALACLYMRSRWGDFQQTDSVHVDYDSEGVAIYLEYRATVFKTMNAKFWEGEPALWIAPALGVVDKPWLDTWIQVRAELGLGSISLPLPAPSSEGTATTRDVSTTEITSWLQKMLPREDQNLSAHSLKRTLLSYANKRGMETVDKLILGSHAHPGKMANTYGDDLLARPLRLLEALLREIRGGDFDPDLSRSGMLRKETALEVQGLTIAARGERMNKGEEPYAATGSGSLPCSFDKVSFDDLQANFDEDEPLSALGACADGDGTQGGSEAGSDTGAGIGGDQNSSSEDESESTSSSSEVLTDTDNKQGARIMGVPSPAPGTRFMVHRRSRMLHMLPDNNKKVLLCGRVMQGAYEPATDVRFDSSVCTFCRRHVQA